MKYLDNNGLSHLIQKIKSWLNGKVDKIDGKTLTTNDFTNAYKTAVDTNATARHSHSNKTVLDGITSAKITEWDNKLDSDNMPEEVFYWDGRNSAVNSNNKTLGQKIYDAWKNNKKLVVVANKDNELIVMDNISLTTNDDGSKELVLTQTSTRLSNGNTVKQTKSEAVIYIDSSDVVTSFSPWSSVGSTASFVKTTSAPGKITDTDITNWNNKQDSLVSGTNIKTINNESLLGSGNIEISGSDEAPIYHWDGLSSSDNPENLALMQKVYDAYISGKPVALSFTKDGITSLFDGVGMLESYMVAIQYDSSFSNNVSNGYFACNISMMMAVVDENGIVQEVAPLEQSSENGSFIQEESDPLFAESAAYGITSDDITAWNNNLEEEVFVWDGKSSSTNSANLALFQKIYDTWRTTGKAVVIATMSDGERVLFSRMSVLSDKFYLVGNYAELSISGTNKWGYQYTREVKATIGSNNTITSVPALTTDYDTCLLQDRLVSGTNIKTINNQSLLGSGNINIASSGQALWEDITSSAITYSSDITLSSEGQNKVYKILDKFVYFSCVCSRTTGATNVKIGTIAEQYRPPATLHFGGVGAANSHLSVSVNASGEIKTVSASSGNWFGFTLIWAIKDSNE